MPRMLSLIAAVGLVAGSIAWNTACWPVVWEMTAPQDEAAQPAETPQALPASSSDAAQAAVLSETAAKVEAVPNATAEAAVPHASTAEAAVPHATTSDLLPAAQPEARQSEASRGRQPPGYQSGGGSWPAEVVPADRYAAAARSDLPGRRLRERELVPIKFAATAGEPAGVDLGNGVRRLPPVERTETTASGGRAGDPAPATGLANTISAPAYLSTGF